MMNRTAAARALAMFAGTALLLFVVVTKTASNLYWDRQPAIALRFDGSNNFALSKIANASLLTQQQDGLNLDLASRYALKAVRRAPRDSSSLAVLAFAADAGKFRTPGLPLAERAQSYSKRTLLAQLYFIQENAKAGRVGQTLAYYDLALTTHPNSQPLLLPRLYGAIVAPEVRRELIRILATDPSWRKDFWLGLTNLRPLPPAALQLIEEVGPQSPALEPGIAPRLVWALASGNRFEDAARVAAGAKDNGVVRSARTLDDFLKDEPSPPIDWQLDNSGAFNAVPGKSELLLSVRGSQEVTFARRLLFLRAGSSFALSGNAVGHFGQGSLGLTVGCAVSGATLATQSLEISGQGSTPFHLGPFVPPPDCAEQWLIVSGLSSGMGRMELGLKDVSVSPEAHR